MCARYQPCLSFWAWKQDAVWQRLGTTQCDAAVAAVSTRFHTRKATLVSQDCGETFLVMWWDLSDNQRFFRMRGRCVFSHASWKMITFKPYFWCSKPLCQWHQTNKIWFTTTIALVDAVGHPRQLLLDLPFPWHSSRKKMKTDLFLYSLPTLQMAAGWRWSSEFLNGVFHLHPIFTSPMASLDHRRPISRLKKWPTPTNDTSFQRGKHHQIGCHCENQHSYSNHLATSRGILPCALLLSCYHLWNTFTTLDICCSFHADTFWIGQQKLEELLETSLSFQQKSGTLHVTFPFNT